MDGDEFFPAGITLSPALPSFSGPDRENGGGVFLSHFFKIADLKSGDGESKSNTGFTTFRRQVWEI